MSTTATLANQPTRQLYRRLLFFFNHCRWCRLCISWRTCNTTAATERQNGNLSSCVSQCWQSYKLLYDYG